MILTNRYITKFVKSDLIDKMVFVGGPRQVGKTTCAKNIFKFKDSIYLNWDILEDRQFILNQQFPNHSFIIFDEIHKFSRWRNYIKGLFDKFGKEKQILVTGSARLDYYRYSGDSLQGRYHYHRLHPLTVSELKIKTQSDFEQLLKLGGFPEPFFSGSEVKAKRWSKEYRQRFVREDISELERAQDLSILELALLRLPELVGSPLSINGLREDLQIAHKTLARYLDIFERMYSIFRISPFGGPKLNAVKQIQKHYHFDWTLVDDMSMRFENLIALHLLKWVHHQEDHLGEDVELRYYRDQETREVDFVIVKKRIPIQAIEVKWSDSEISNSLKYFKSKFPACECLQVSAIGKNDYLNKEGIALMPWNKFLSKLI